MSWRVQLGIGGRDGGAGDVVDSKGLSKTLVGIGRVFDL